MDYLISASFVLLGGIVAAVPLFIIGFILTRGNDGSNP